MATEKQIAANRRNALKCTGPKTREGKFRSSLNALKHGIYAHQFIVTTEDEAVFNNYTRDILDTFEPQNNHELDLVRTYIRSTWRHNRIAAANNLRLSLALKEVKAEQSTQPEPITDPTHLTLLALDRLEASSPAYARHEAQELRLAAASHRAATRLEALLDKKRESEKCRNETNFSAPFPARIP